MTERIIVITTTETDRHGRRQLIASHGVGERSLRSVTLSTDHPSVLGAVFDSTVGEWVLEPTEDADS